MTPLARMLVYFGGVVLVFVVQDTVFFLTAAFLAICTFVFFPNKRFRSGAIPISIFLAVTFAANLMFKEGRVVFSLYGLEITHEGLTSATVTTARALLMIIGAKLLIYATGIEDLAAALGRLLRPLRVLKLPVEEFTEMMLLTIKAFPLLKDRLMTDYRCQVATANANGLTERAAIALSLFVSVLADILASPERFFEVYKGNERQSSGISLRHD
ncbi:Cobalt transport protein [Candidatus Magnetobacterium bavaricum]|uniref:Cobalt transport protein n=1 Tax=Candidatus Magnetobacterium bavaricum TaxID=29290 RepID=A0A0F3GT14_9BACT|nr:Cobalt transport protein [Candidatus Magnetobacterium bavaricum]